MGRPGGGPGGRPPPTPNPARIGRKRLKKFPAWPLAGPNLTHGAPGGGSHRVLNEYMATAQNSFLCGGCGASKFLLLWCGTRQFCHGVALNNIPCQNERDGNGTGCSAHRQNCYSQVYTKNIARGATGYKKSCCVGSGGRGAKKHFSSYTNHKHGPASPYRTPAARPMCCPTAAGPTL